MNRKFVQIPTHLDPMTSPSTIRRALEPIRDAVQRRFQGKNSGERVVTRADLIALGLATESDIEKLED